MLSSVPYLIALSNRRETGCLKVASSPFIVTSGSTVTDRVFPVGHLNDLCVGIDDGERSFDFMAGIRDKTLLLFIAFGYGLYRLFREKHNKAEHQKQTGNADAYAGQQKGEEGGEFPLAVQKNIHGCGISGICGNGNSLIAVRIHKAAFFVFVP